VLGGEGVPPGKKECRDLLDERSMLGPARRNSLFCPFDVASVEELDESPKYLPGLASIVLFELDPVPQSRERTDARHGVVRIERPDRERFVVASRRSLTTALRWQTRIVPRRIGIQG
jgi:hypothetical protein